MSMYVLWRLRFAESIDYEFEIRIDWKLVI